MPKSVNADISDIFFNTDTGAKCYEPNDPYLRESAQQLINSLNRLCIHSGLVPSVDDLVADFLRRV